MDRTCCLVGLWQQASEAMISRKDSRVCVTSNHRYTNLKPIGDGSYGFVCAADDTVRSNTGWQSNWLSDRSKSLHVRLSLRPLHILTYKQKCTRS